MKGRGSGILLHLTSLPSPFGIGDLGPWAHKFADFLAETKQSYWQILPLNPTDLGHGSSPYHSTSAFACNPLLISPELLLQDGLLVQEDLNEQADFPEERVDYSKATAYKHKLLHLAFERFVGKKDTHEYEEFCEEHTEWLEDYALFVALKSHFHGQVWSKWPEDIRDRKPAAVQSAKKEFRDVVEKEIFLQYVFSEQWKTLKRYCNEKGVQIIGDMPIYVIHDSADVWVHPNLFKLDHEKRPYAVAGVPPDYFSETGQLWGNPVYRWDVLKEKGYSWWVQRIAHNLKLFDFVRIDHFRGFVAYWEVPAFEETATNGKWIEAPAVDLFNRIKKEFPHLPIIAEDLGTITHDVRKILRHFEFPCMKVLLFAFGEDLPTNPYAPHNYEGNCVVYTGTHDNNTARGWFEKEARPEEKKRLFLYLGREVTGEEVHWELARLAMMSVANTAILPMQDVLGLGEQARMNRPAKKDGNWQWRLLPDQLTSSVADRLFEMTEIYGRA
ncbi:MAG: 4-alpha-glucanotransferase [Deltaproteobacteria bacterium]|nr:MAG: 4-alpha-glucanotransferase [Deltaproteobacteria bacterium]